MKSNKHSSSFTTITFFAEGGGRNLFVSSFKKENNFLN